MIVKVPKVWHSTQYMYKMYMYMRHMSKKKMNSLKYTDLVCRLPSVAKKVAIMKISLVLVIKVACTTENYHPLPEMISDSPAFEPFI